MGMDTIEYRLLPRTRASVGRAGGHSVVVDRVPEKAGGMGLGFNGGQLLALAIGGCFCNDLQVFADALGVEIADLRISVSIDYEGNPSLAVDARMTVDCTLADGSDPAELIERAKAATTIGNSLRQGIPVSIAAAR